MKLILTEALAGISFMATIFLFLLIAIALN